MDIYHKSLAQYRSRRALKAVDICCVTIEKSSLCDAWSGELLDCLDAQHHVVLVWCIVGLFGCPTSCCTILCVCPLDVGFICVFLRPISPIQCRVGI